MLQQEQEQQQVTFGASNKGGEEGSESLLSVKNMRNISLEKEGMILQVKSKKGNWYVYDACTNMIYPLSKKLLKIIKSFYKIEEEGYVSNPLKNFNEKIIGKNYEFKFIRNLINKYHAFCCNGGDTLNFVPKSREELEREISNLSQIELEVTQSCNLRCSYCIYSGRYEDFRIHSKKKMSFEIAKRSLDYFFSLICSPKRTKRIGDIYIGFFGGEPLLAFDLIKKCVEYVNNKLLNKRFLKDKIWFHITTNGVLLNDVIANFLIENDFLVAISLDGPREEHDKNRLYANGKGTFEIIFENVKKLMKYNSHYFDTHVIFELTLSSNHNLLRINNFFKKILGNRSDKLKASFVRNENFFFSELKSSLEKLKKRWYNKVVKRQTLSPLMEVLFSYLYKPFVKKFFMGNIKKTHFTSTCLPDSFRLFVSADGNFHVCERINQFFPIGNYQKGIQFEKVKRILDYYNSSVVKKCIYCIARHFCPLCYALIAQGKEYKTEKVCKDTKLSFQQMLIEFISLMEENPEIFAYEKNGKKDVFEEIFF